MPDALSDRMAPVVALCGVLAVLLAGLGGVAADDRLRLLCGAGGMGCFIALGGCLMFAGQYLSREEDGRCHAALGGLAGLCVGLFFSGVGNLAVLVVHLAAGAVLGITGYWLRVYRQPSFWNE